MAKYTLLPAKKIWFTLGLLSLICVENINSFNKGCPPIFEVFENELKLESSIINTICRTEYYVDELSGDSSSDSSGSKPQFKSICSFDCDEYIEFCPLLSKKIHYTLIYNYDDFRWKYNEILTVCKNWDELFYTPEPSSSTTTATTTIDTTTATTTIDTTTATTTIDTTTATTTDTITTGKQSQSNSDAHSQYSKGGTIGIITVIGLLMGIVTGISVYLCRAKF
jgi:hypothetical protein